MYIIAHPVGNLKLIMILLQEKFLIFVGYIVMKDIVSTAEARK